MYRKIGMIAAVAVPALMALTPAAHASTAQTTMAVTAVTLNSCSVVALPLVFGNISQVNGTATDSQTTLTVVCTPGVNYNVGLDQGAHAAGGTRQMQAVLGTATIPYTLYSDSTRTTVWGNTVNTDTVSGTAGVLPGIYQVYGREPGNATLVGAGAYADAVTVTVTF